MRLVTLWLESSYIDNQAWVLDYLTRLTPRKVKVAGLVRSDGTWDFSLADAAQSRLPHAEIIFRPLSPDEGSQWQSIPPRQWIANAKAQLQGRPYCVTFDCEPANKGVKLTNYLAYSANLMTEAYNQSVKVDMWGIQPQAALLMFTQDEDDITKGKWDTCLKLAGELRGTVTIDYHTYTSLVLPAGTFDDSYLRRVATEPELLRDSRTWGTWEQITSPNDLQRYRTRHLFRHLWLNYRADEIGAKRHDYFIGESPFDWYNEGDIAETMRIAKGIAGDDLNCYPENTPEQDRKVAGIRTLRNWTRWKFPQWSFEEAIARQIQWYETQLANDPHCQGFALYAYTEKNGDQQAYNFAREKPVLEKIIEFKPAVTQPAPPPPVVQPPAPVPTPRPLRLVTTVDVRLRVAPSIGSQWEFVVAKRRELYPIEPQVYVKAKVGKNLWIAVELCGKVLYVNAQYVELV